MADKPLKSINDSLMVQSLGIPYPSSGSGWGMGQIYSSMDQWDRAIDSRFWYGGDTAQTAKTAAAIGDPAQSSLVMAAIRFLSSALPEAPLTAKTPIEEDDTGKKEKYETVTDHPLIKLWNRPNKYCSGSRLKKAIAYSWILSGNAYLLKVWDKSHSTVKELWWEPHWSIRPVWPVDGSEFIAHYEVNRNGQWMRVDESDVIHLADGIDPMNPRLGLCGLLSLTREIYGDLQTGNFYSSLLGGSAVPPFVASIDKDINMKPEEIKEFQRDLENNTSGARKGKPVVAKGVRIYKMGFSPQDLDMRTARMMPEERFAAVMGIPAVVMELGAGMDHSIYNNVQAAMRRAYQSYVVPLWKHIEEELQIHLLLDFEDEDTDVVLEHDLSEVEALEEDQTSKATRISAQFTAGVITRAEARSLQGYGPSDPEHPESDDVFQLGQVQLVPVHEPEPGDEDYVEPVEPMAPDITDEQIAAMEDEDGKIPAAAVKALVQRRRKFYLKGRKKTKQPEVSNEEIQKTIRWLRKERFNQAADLMMAKPLDAPKGKANGNGKVLS